MRIVPFWMSAERIESFSMSGEPIRPPATAVAEPRPTTSAAPTATAAAAVERDFMVLFMSGRFPSDVPGARCAGGSVRCPDPMTTSE